MKKPALISALALAAVAAASLALPASASAASFRELAAGQGRAEPQRVHERRHDGGDLYNHQRRDSHHHGSSRWAPSPHYRDRGHYGHRHHYRYGYRPTQHYHRYNDDLRVRIVYDLHL